MGLSLIEKTFWILGILADIRGHIPQFSDYHAIRTASPVAISPAAVMGVVAVAILAIGLASAALWAAVWLAIRLI